MSRRALTLGCAPISQMEASMNPQLQGSRLDADHPETGVLIPRRFTHRRDTRLGRRAMAAARHRGRACTRATRSRRTVAIECGSNGRAERHPAKPST